MELITDFYFAHNFDDRIEYRKIELALEEELGIELFNPFYDDPERGEEMKELDAKGAYAADRIEQLTKGEQSFTRTIDKPSDIVFRDYKNLASKRGLFTIVKKPSFGTGFEISTAHMMRKPIVLISELYSMHPFIRHYVDFRYKTIDDFKEKYIESKKYGVMLLSGV